MREFFKGWRRKVGCGLLVLACVVCGAWVRSLSIRDQILFLPRGNEFQMIASAAGTVRWGRISLQSTVFERDDYLPVWRSMTLDQDESSDHFWSQRIVEWRWNCGEFDFGAGANYIGGPRTVRWAFPYWSFAAPLTILSATLILWKPRKRTEPEHA
ncbi:MAG: hypothetical protein JSS49_00020 [Planctomycetes bacterium]|nr:hypothetical protein [Planctomycetota bacterium]